MKRTQLTDTVKEVLCMTFVSPRVIALGGWGTYLVLKYIHTDKTVDLHGHSGGITALASI